MPKLPHRIKLSKSDAELASCCFACAGAIFAFGSLIALFFVTVNLAFKLMQRFVISMAYGPDRYVAGLRIVKKNFQLSDGTTLPGRWEFVYILGTFMFVCLVMFPYVRLLQRWGLLRDGDETQPTTDPQDGERAS